MIRISTQATLTVRHLTRYVTPAISATSSLTMPAARPSASSTKSSTSATSSADHSSSRRAPMISAEVRRRIPRRMAPPEKESPAASSLEAPDSLITRKRSALATERRFGTKEETQRGGRNNRRERFFEAGDLCVFCYCCSMNSSNFRAKFQFVSSKVKALCCLIQVEL